MQYTINQLYDIIHQKIYTIRDIFNIFFSEENVDLHLIERNKMEIYKELTGAYDGFYAHPSDKLYEVSDDVLNHLINYNDYKNVFIYVHFPLVTVTNDNNKSINIQDLYAKIEINLKGNIPYESPGFTLNRATYSKKQFLADYLHSHIRNIPKDNFTTFMQPCLGRGPIRNTIMSIKNDYDESLWMLFCQELSMYVTVESLVGGPWKKLEQIGYGKALWYNDFSLTDTNTYAFYAVSDRDTLKNFTAYYLQNGHLSISYKDNSFIIGMPFYDYIIDLSNSFIDYYNQYLKSEDKVTQMFEIGLLQKVLIKNRQFYRYSQSNDDDITRYQHKYIFTFKGQSIYTRIFEDIESEETTTTLIDYQIAMYILSNILKVINFRYKNEHCITTPGSNTSAAATAYQKVLYI